MERRSFSLDNNSEHHRHRVLTVLMVDLVRSTEMCERLSVHALRQTLFSYYSYCDDIISKTGGHAIRFEGDAVLANYASDTSLHQSAAMAVLAGSAIVSNLATLAISTVLHDAGLQCRVAVTSGVGIICTYNGSAGTAQTIVCGDMPFLAERIKPHAPPGGIVLCKKTATLLRQDSNLTKLGVYPLKGFGTPRAVYQYLPPPSAQS